MTLSSHPVALGDHEGPNVFLSDLHEWWRAHGRNFPWRATRDPYRVLIAELMLHRTKADQVLPVYTKFVRRYPDTDSFVNSRPDELREILRPLGLRWRTELIVELAQTLGRGTNGVIPADFDALSSLPGVGDYIASAVCCFAYGEPTALLDTNIVRILARVTGLETRDSDRRSSRMRSLVHALVDTNRPREFYFGLLDLGALVCRPANPNCSACPIRSHCVYSNQDG